ncbi:MAG: hypothetical protein GY702_20270, partial [Desulfobulbaceae bacterium]|nr:hypothetical protein [Desulfobulbaceae bacterium]
MKNNTTIFKLILSLFLCSLLITGCLGKDRFDNSAIRYQMVEIPDYEISDYEDLLASENDVAKYNAICNLIKYAWDYAGILKKATTKNPDSKEKMPAKEEIEKANKVLSDIFTGLTDENENIKAASLIFLTEFSLNYSDKDMLYKQVEKVKAYSLRTQYEHIRALAILSNSETKIDKNLIETYLDSKSWLVANMTYLFLGKISCEEFHK